MGERNREQASKVREKEDQLERLRTELRSMKERCGKHPEVISGLMKTIEGFKTDKQKLKRGQKEHKRSQLIQNLNREIDDQDVVIEVLQKMVVELLGKENEERTQAEMDARVVKELTKGPARELKMEIKRLNNQVLLLRKSKGGPDKVRPGPSVPVLEQPESGADDGLSETNNFEAASSAEQQLRINLQHKDIQIDSLNQDISRLKTSIEHLKQMENERNYYRQKHQSYLSQQKRQKQVRLGKVQDALGSVIGGVLGVELNDQDEFDLLLNNCETIQSSANKLERENERLLQLYNSEKLRNSALVESMQEIKKMSEEATSKRVSSLQQLQQEADQLKAELTRRQKINADLDKTVAVLKRSNEDLAAKLKGLEEGKGSMSKEDERAFLAQNQKLMKEIKELRDVKLGSKDSAVQFMRKKTEELQKRYKQLFDSNLALKKLLVKHKVPESEVQQAQFDQQKIIQQLFKMNEEQGQKRTGGRGKVVKVSLTRQEQDRLDHTDSSIGSLHIPPPDSGQLVLFDSDCNYEVEDKDDSRRLPPQRLLDDVNSDVSDLVGIIQVADRSLKENSLYSVQSAELYERGLQKGFYSKGELEAKGVPMKSAKKVKASVIADLDSELKRLGGKMKKGKVLQVTNYDMKRFREVDSEVGELYSGKFDSREDSEVDLRIGEFGGQDSSLSLEELGGVGSEGSGSYQDDELAGTNSDISGLDFRR